MRLGARVAVETIDNNTFIVYGRNRFRVPVMEERMRITVTGGQCRIYGEVQGICPPRLFVNNYVLIV